MGTVAPGARFAAGLDALVELTSALAQAETVSQLCERTLAVVERALGVERASVLLLDEDGVMRFRAWSGLSEGYRAATEGHSPWTTDTPDPQPLVVEDVLEDAGLAPLREVIAREGIRALAFVPIAYGGRLVGKYMLYYPEPRALADDELLLARMVADQVAVAVQRQRDEGSLRLSRDQLRAVFSGVTDAITVQGPDWQLVYANEAAARLLGASSPEELVATPVAEIAARFEALDEDGSPLSPDDLPARRVFAGAPSAERVVVYRRRESGEERASLVRATPVRNEDGSVRFVVNVIQDVTDRRRRELWQRLLADTSSILAETLVSDETLERIAQLAIGGVADWCAVHEPGEVRPRLVTVAHRDPERVRLAWELTERYPPDANRPGGVGEALRTGTSQLLSEITDEMLAAAATNDEHLRLLRTLELSSAMVLPLVARGRTLAAVTFAKGGGRFLEADLAAAEEFAKRAALAVDNARLYEEVAKSEELTRTITENAVSALFLVDERGHPTYLNEAAERMFGYRLEEIAGAPLHDAVHHTRPDGTPYPIEECPIDRALPEHRTLAPYEDVFVRKDGSFVHVRASASPILRGTVPVGTVVEVQDVTRERERELRLRDAEARARFVAEVSEALAESFDIDETLAKVARLAVPELADFSFFDLLEEDGSLVRAAAAHVSDEAFTRRTREFVPGPDSRHPARRALADRRPVLVRTVDERWVASVAESPEHAQFMRDLGLSSVLSLPLQVGSELLGVLTLERTGRRAYDEADLETARELARRAAVAVQHARLYQRAEFQRALLEAQSEASVDGLLVVGPAGEVLSANRRFADIWQIPDEVLARGDDAALALAVERLEDPEAFLARVRELYERREASREELRFRDGRTIERYATPLFGPDGRYEGHLWSFRDITSRKRTEEALAVSLEREREARDEAERAARVARRLQLVTASLSGALTRRQVAEVIAGQGVLALGAQAGAVFLLSEDGAALEPLAHVGYPPELVPQFSRAPLGVPGPTTEALQTGEIVTVGSGGELVERWPHYREAQRVSGDEATLAVPLPLDGRPGGVLYIAFRAARAFREQELDLARTLARQCGQALERASLYEQEHEVALTLQRSLLPRQLPVRDTLELAAVYRPGSAGLNVGGDWYDALELPDGRIAFSVGDVVGRGLEAATVMGELRNTLRPYLLDNLAPDEALRRLNALAFSAGALSLTEEAFATTAVAVLDVGRGRLELSSAGHPPPLLVDPEGGATFLETVTGPPIGAVEDAVFRTVSFPLAPRATLLLYTDGLVERRDRPLTERLHELAAAAHRGSELPVEALCRSLLEALVGDEEIADDLALLAVRLVATPTFRRRVRAKPAELAPLRRALRGWLVGVGADDDAVYDLVLAASEACANAIEHPVGARNRLVDVEARVVEDGEAVLLLVRNSGEWRTPEPSTVRGRGLMLIESVMDEVEIDRSPERTEIRMLRRLRTAR
ncbi:MAG TPA: GAF domain-containing protein [Gaiellaceae bacterium]|nr:GAF domain-containing protein [Gaiellaceae bacterium]